MNISKFLKLLPVLAIALVFSSCNLGSSDTVTAKADLIVIKDSTPNPLSPVRTWRITGSQDSGDKIDVSCTYINIMAKEDAAWKMSKSVIMTSK